MKLSKEKILLAAEEVFSNHGYHRASMDEIAQKASVAKGTLYYHFPGKAQLFKTLVMNGFQQMVDKTRSDLGARLTLEEQIRQIIGHHLDLFLESSSFAHIVFNELSNGIDSDVLEPLKQVRDHYIQFIATVIEEGKEYGVARAVNSQLAAAAILGMLDSGCKTYLRHQDTLSREDLERFFYTMVTQGLFVTGDSR